jgi:Fe(3+) dicitrate transport protein
MYRFILPILLINIVPINTIAQKKDTTKAIILNQIEVTEERSLLGNTKLPDLKDNVIYAGKKNEVIQLAQSHADLSTNNARQVFAKVPGISVWENDGSGIQVGVASRGLSPNRSWEFNVRQNGSDISSEAFGYPEAYYTPPMEALEKIEVVRGAASLQYGSQFGGLLNYQVKKGNPDKPMSIESQQTIGFFGLYDTYNAIGGGNGKVSYYSFLHYRSADGWRDNSQYRTLTGYASIGYQFSTKLNIQLDYTRSSFKSQQPGGLTDQQLVDNPRQSSRKRNWFNAPWNIVSMTLKYAFAPNLNLQIKSFATISERNSVGFTKAINVEDAIDPKTLQYSARQVDRDYYQNFGSEARLSWRYSILGKESILAGGVRVYSGNTKRNQLGIGTTGSDFDLTLANQEFGRSLQFTTANVAFFAENIFYLNKRWKVVPGIRVENIKNTAGGYINSTSTGGINSDSRTRNFVLLGMGSEFLVSPTTNIYGNFSQAYRPVTFSELTPSATTDIIDPNLKDASGYNIDLGYRGSIKSFLNFDVGVFYLNYENRIGTISQNNQVFRTNIGTSVSKGIESFIELNVIKAISENSKVGDFSLFASNAFIDATYVKWNNPAISGDPTKSIEGKRVENAPSFIHRFGATYAIAHFSATCQLSSVSDVFTDAANTELPNAIATIGKIKGYEVLDVSAQYRFPKNIALKAGINNVTNGNYTARRSGGYPGPGILPGNGRTIFVGVGVKF